MDPFHSVAELEGCLVTCAASGEASTETLAPGDAGRPAALLRGSARGLDLIVRGSAGSEAIAAALSARLAEAPSFFRGSEVRVLVEDGPLPAGGLSRLDALAEQFELRIVEVAAARGKPSEDDAVPQPSLAAGSAPAPVVAEPADLAASIDDPRPLRGSCPQGAPRSPTPLRGSGSFAPAESFTNAAVVATPSPPRAEPEPAPAPPALDGARVVVGPIRSGVILEHAGHLVVFGDVNPGAEIRAEGNIVVLGRLRGTAHAGIGREVGFIVALRLEPQQLRICRKVARAGDSDKAGTAPEIAHVTGDDMVVERYHGRLPGSLAASI